MIPYSIIDNACKKLKNDELIDYLLILKSWKENHFVIYVCDRLRFNMKRCKRFLNRMQMAYHMIPGVIKIVAGKVILSTTPIDQSAVELSV